MKNLLKNSVIAEIERAFGRTAPPREVVRNQDGIWENPELCKSLEELDVIKLFKGRAWWDVDSTYVYGAHKDGDMEMSYTYLLSEAFAYYLPSLLMLALDPLETENDQSAYGWIQELEFQLSPNGASHAFPERISHFTSEQKSAIAKCFLYINKNISPYSIKTDIMDYWAQFL